MKDSVKKEVKQLIKEYDLNCSIREFKDRVYWYGIFSSKVLSEDFIREFKDYIGWDIISKYQILSESFIREFEDKVDWIHISCYQTLSEEFIREFKDKVSWFNISENQQLSEEFIREFKDKVSWNMISYYQNLSEEFIREFKNKVNWNYICRYQTLSEEFIREFKDKVDWVCMYEFQNLSKSFIKEFKNNINTKVYNKVHKTLSYEEKLKKVKQYCEKHKLTIDETNKCFYAYRNHDKHGRGNWNKTIFYKKGKYYKDWHLDMREDEENSFGIGIFPEGDTKVKVLIDDFGVCVNRKYGKCRVWGFEIV